MQAEDLVSNSLACMVESASASGCKNPQINFKQANIWSPFFNIGFLLIEFAFVFIKLYPHVLPTVILSCYCWMHYCIWWLSSFMQKLVSWIGSIILFLYCITQFKSNQFRHFNFCFSELTLLLLYSLPVPVVEYKLLSPNRSWSCSRQKISE